MAANPILVEQRGISEDAVRRINVLHNELQACLTETDEYLRETDRTTMYDWFESIEYALQRLWGFEEDHNYHTWYRLLMMRYRELDYLGATYRCELTGDEGVVTSDDIHSPWQLFKVGQGFIDFGISSVRIVGLERVK